MNSIARQRLRTFREWTVAQVRVRLPGQDRDRGAILILCALVLAVLVVAVALTVDFGRLTTTKRDLHTIADQAAFDGYRALSDPANLSLPIYSTVADRAADSATRNGFPANNGATYKVSGGHNTLKVELGIFSTLDAPPYPSTTLAPTTVPPSTSTTVPTAGSFTPLNPSDCPPAFPVPGTTTTVPGTCSDAEQHTANSVRVTATTDVKWFFVPGSQAAVGQAVAGGNGFTGIQVGSFAARVSAGCAPTAPPPPTTTTTSASTTTTGLLGGLGMGRAVEGPSVVAAGEALTPAQAPRSQITVLPTTTTTTSGPTTTTTLLPPLTTTTAPTTTAAPTTTTTLVPPPPAVDPCTILANALFGVNLTAAAYQGLANSSVTLGQLASALSVATPQQLLATSLTAGQVANATATALDNQGNTSAGASSATIAAAEGTIPPPPSPSPTTTTAPPSTTTTSSVAVSTTVTTTVGGTTPTTVPIPTTSSTVAPIGPNGTAPLPGSVPFDQVTGDYGGSVGTGSTAAAQTHFDALDLLVASFTAEFGNNQSSVSVPGFNLGLTLPGVGTITAYTNFSIIEPPQAGYGPRCPAVPSPPAETYTGCANAHSAQLVAAVMLAVPVTTAIGTLTLAIPLVVQAGHGQAWVTNIACRTPNDGQAEVDFMGHTDAADVSLGTVSVLSTGALGTLQPLLDAIAGAVGSAGFPGLPLPPGGTPSIPATPPGIGSPISLPVPAVNQSIGAYDTPPPGFNFPAGTPFNPNRGPITVGLTSANVPAGVAYNVDNALQMIAATAGPQITGTPVAGLTSGVLTTLQSAFDSVLPQIGPYLLDPLDSFLRVGIGGEDVVNLPVPPGPTPTQGTNCNAPQVVQ